MRADFERLRLGGWCVEFASVRTALPSDVAHRYAWLPAEHRELIETLQRCTSADDTRWFVTAADFCGTSNSAFAWNEWERLSLEAAGDDTALRASITRFWDAHCPVLLSVKSGYDYWALDQASLRIVRGSEPEFECAVEAAPSLLEFVRRLG